MSRGNNVRGPASALTEFLKEQGITPTTIARRVATQNEPPTAGPSTLRQAVTAEEETAGEQAEEPEPDSRSTRRTRTAANTEGYASDDLDEPEQPQPKKRKLSKAAEAKAKAKAKEAAKKGKKGKKDDEEDDEEDAYTALSKSLWTNKPRPAVGSFATCAQCETQFTVTKYTISATNGPGLLCHKCAKSSGVDPFKKTAAPKKRKAPADKRKPIHLDERRLPSLASVCIEIISRHIDDVEALGDIGTINMERICKAISKNRSLTNENAPLFYNSEQKTLTMYDATKLTPDAFSTLGYLNSSLTHLRIDLCGRMDDSTISTWTTSMPSLIRLELLGPFLVRDWSPFFSSHPKLRGFLITQSPRIDTKCIKALVSSCPELTELRLKEVGEMCDDFLEQIALLKNGVTYLDISDPAKSCSEEAMLGLLKVIGSTLQVLDVGGHRDLGDAFLLHGVRQHSRVLTQLGLKGLPELTDKGIAEFFNSWTEPPSLAVPKKGRGRKSTAAVSAPVEFVPNPPLTVLDLSRNTDLSTAALSAVLAHSGATLQRLNVNGWRQIDSDTLNQIGHQAFELKWLDVGWCRNVDDFVLKQIIKCDKLVEVKVWGCNRVSANYPRKRGVAVHGVESM